MWYKPLITKGYTLLICCTSYKGHSKIIVIYLHIIFLSRLFGESFSHSYFNWKLWPKNSTQENEANSDIKSRSKMHHSGAGEK